MTLATQRSATSRFSSFNPARPARLAPLLLALAVGQAYAVEVQLTGANGAPGAAGTAASPQGGDGGAAPILTHTLGTTSDASTKLTLFGGGGGAGGWGWDNFPSNENPFPEPGGTGGVGGAGAYVEGRVSALLASGNVLVDSIARGGSGGEAGFPGCCSTYLMGLGGMGGAATSITEAATYGSGTATTLTSAFGGAGAPGGDGGGALANGSGWSTAGAVSGKAVAQGGAGGPIDYIPNQTPYRGGNGGNASASLSLTGAGMASGEVTATGGDGTSNYLADTTAGSATGYLELFGAGASGTSVATRGYGRWGLADSKVRAITTGALEVDVTSRAVTGINSGVSADVYVDSGYSTPAAGNALVTGRAFAEGGDYSSDRLASATLTLFGSGSIIGSSDARGMDGWGDTCYYGCGGGGNAFSSASGVTSGHHNVTITAYAGGGASHVMGEGQYMGGGRGQAIAYGKSGSGVVNVKAEALSHTWEEQIPGAKATAITTAAGGSSFAEARHVAVHDTYSYANNYSAAATASSVGSGGARALASGQGFRGGLVADASASGGAGVVVSGHATLSGFGAGVAESKANVGGAAYALPAFDGGMQAVSHVTGEPLAADVAVLLSQSPELAMAGTNWRGAGVMAAAGGEVGDEVTTQGGFTFTTIEGQHLMLGLFAPVSTAFGINGLDFSITNNGVQLFSRSFDGADDLDLFFSNRLLDLGLVGAGAQNLLISATWQLGSGAGYGFRYVVGATAVPEPGSWMMMVLGLCGLLLVARRQGRQPAF